MADNRKNGIPPIQNLVYDIHMRKKQLTFFLIILTVLVGVYCIITMRSSGKTSISAVSLADQSAVAQTVTDFGHNLQMVSLLAPSSYLKKSMDDAYTPYVASELLALWEKNPSSAPGRMTSSPWPDRIEISNIVVNTDGSYTVAGTVIEVTSTELKNGTASDTYPITMTLQKWNNVWLITSFSKGLPVIK